MFCNNGGVVRDGRALWRVAWSTIAAATASSMTTSRGYSRLRSTQATLPSCTGHPYRPVIYPSAGATAAVHRTGLLCATVFVLASSSSSCMSALVHAASSCSLVVTRGRVRAVGANASCLCVCLNMGIVALC